MIIILLRRGIAIAVSLAIVYFAYNYLKDRGMPVPQTSTPQSQLQNAQDAAKQNLPGQ